MYYIWNTNSDIDIFYISSIIILFSVNEILLREKKKIEI